MSPREHTYTNKQQNTAQEFPFPHEAGTVLPDDESFYNVAEDLNPPRMYVDEEGEKRPHHPKPRENFFWDNLVYERTGLYVPIDVFNPFQSGAGAFSFGIDDDLYPNSTSEHDDSESEAMDDGHDADDNSSFKCNANAEHDEDDHSFHGDKNRTEDNSNPNRADNLSDFVEADVQEEAGDDSQHLSNLFDDYLHPDNDGDLGGTNQSSSHFAESSRWHYTYDSGYDSNHELDMSGDEDDDEGKFWSDDDLATHNFGFSGTPSDWLDSDTDLPMDEEQFSESWDLEEGNGTPLEFVVTDNDMIALLSPGTPPSVFEVSFESESDTDQSASTDSKHNRKLRKKARKMRAKRVQAAKGRKQKKGK